MSGISVEMIVVAEAAQKAVKFEKIGGPASDIQRKDFGCFRCLNSIEGGLMNEVGKFLK